MKRHTIDGIEIELDDDVDPADLDQGAAPRQPGEVDLDALQVQAEADAIREDDTAEPYATDEDGDA